MTLPGLFIIVLCLAVLASAVEAWRNRKGYCYLKK